jgi:hypothetical protein
VMIIDTPSHCDFLAVHVAQSIAHLVQSIAQVNRTS